MTSYHTLFLFAISLTFVGVKSNKFLSNYELKPVDPMVAPPLDSREEESVPEPLKAFSWVLPAALSSSNYSNSNKNPHPQESYQRQNVHHSSSRPREKQVDPSRFLTRIYHAVPVTYSSSVQVSRPSLPKTSRRSSSSSSPEASASSPGQATSSFYSFSGPDPGYGYGSESQGQIPSHYGPSYHNGHGSSPYSYSGPNGYAYSGPGGKGHTRYYSSPDGNSHSSSYSHSYSDSH